MTRGLDYLKLQGLWDNKIYLGIDICWSYFCHKHCSLSSVRIRSCLHCRCHSGRNIVSKVGLLQVSGTTLSILVAISLSFYFNGTLKFTLVILPFLIWIVNFMFNRLSLSLIFIECSLITTQVNFHPWIIFLAWANDELDRNHRFWSNSHCPLEC